MPVADSWKRPEVEHLRTAYDHLFRKSLSLTRLREAAIEGRLPDRSLGGSVDGVVGRSMAWKLFLIPTEPLSSVAPESPARSPIASLRKLRTDFVNLAQERLRAPDGGYEEGLSIPGVPTLAITRNVASPNLEIHNPLSLAEDNKWRQWYKTLELRNTIKQDVERTFPDIQYFHNPEVQSRLTVILFLHSVTHPGVGYRQGMHELLAPIYYALDYDSISDSVNADEEMKEFICRTWVTADAWALFGVLMDCIGSWYEWQETERPIYSPLDRQPPGYFGTDNSGALKPYVAPIVRTCQYMQSALLKVADPVLWQSMETSDIEPQIYGIRWLRLMFTREFNLQDAMVIWDGLFASADIAELTLWICIAMLIRIRNYLIPADYSGQLTYLLRYPSLSEGTASKTPHPSNLLVRQAMTLRMSPNPSTGANVMVENKNLLDIPVEVSSPLPGDKRKTKPSERPRNVTNNEANSAYRHRKDDSVHQQSSFPENFARNLLERGESFGINRTVMNAVSEFRKNLPDISTHGTRPSADLTNSSAFPMLVEKGFKGKPILETRNRFELDREITELKFMQKCLGESVGWAVDTLLQDEGAEYSQDKLTGIKRQKREAIESLAYVRDILNGTVGNIEEERLFGEEEYRQRRSRSNTKERSISPAKRPSDIKINYAPWVSLPRPVMSAKLDSNHHRSDSDTSSQQTSLTSPTHSTLPSPPSAVVNTPQSYISSILPITSGSSNPQSPSSSVSSTAPWNHTSSSFSSPSIDLSSLPRLPPKSTISPFDHLTPIISLPQSGKNSNINLKISTDQAPPFHPREIERDPLGVLH